MAKRNWIQEERRRTLGDWVAFCPTCGHVARYFSEHEPDRPSVCPQCATGLVARCPSCGARLRLARPRRVGPARAPGPPEGEGGGGPPPPRPSDLLGGPIRRPGR